MAKEAKKETGLMSKVDQEALAALKADYPTEATFNRTILPRLALASQDVTEGEGKKMKVITEAGTFFTEEEGEEENEEGKKIWEKNEIGTSIEGVILFQRKQLRYYDQENEEYTSSSVYDSDDQIIPLFKDKKEVARGTPKELKALKKFKFIGEDGKVKSKLEDNRILYVLYKEKVFQLNLRGTSMYAYMTYTRDLQKKGLVPPAVLTAFSSEAKQKGKIKWNQMTFEMKRTLNTKEIQEAVKHVQEVKAAVTAEKEFYASRQSEAAEEADSDEDDEEEEDF